MNDQMRANACAPTSLENSDILRGSGRQRAAMASDPIDLGEPSQGWMPSKTVMQLVAKTAEHLGTPDANL